MQVVVHKNYLTRSVRKLLNKEPEQLDPWDCVAPALKARAVDAPRIVERIRKFKKLRSM